MIQLTIIFVTMSVTILLNSYSAHSQISDLNYFPTHYRNLNRNEKSSKSLSSNHNNELNVNSCGGTFRDKQVIIQSPQYPNFYPKNVHCEYRFYSPFVCSSEFHIQFLDFQLESSLTCTKDRLTIGSDEILCGQVIGIMKYKAMNGILRINFTTDTTIEDKGFKLLVTRLPCSTNDDDIQSNFIENSSTVVVGAPDASTNPNPSTVEPTTRSTVFSSSETPVLIGGRNKHAIAPTTPFIQNHFQENENVPIPSIANYQPICQSQTHTTQSNGLWSNRRTPQAFQPPQSFTTTLPSCCINVYNQKRFYIISPGFPTGANNHNDCLYYIEQHHPNICRLRIEFKYFLMGDWQRNIYNQCAKNFIEIDGHRYCGCKTGTVIYTQWSVTPKVIRFSNAPNYAGIQGFILDITQEDCPYRSNQLPASPSIQLPAENLQFPIDDPRRCSYNYLSWLQFNTNHELLARSICIRNNRVNRFGK